MLWRNTVGGRGDGRGGVEEGKVVALCVSKAMYVCTYLDVYPYCTLYGPYEVIRNASANPNIVSRNLNR